jgi:hypothetical protein
VLAALLVSFRTVPLRSVGSSAAGRRHRRLTASTMLIGTAAMVMAVGIRTVGRRRGRRYRGTL